jgi:hypothetical protein
VKLPAKPEQGAYSIMAAARRWGYPPEMVHNWVQAGRVPGVREHEGMKWISGRVVEVGRPPPSGSFTRLHPGRRRDGRDSRGRRPLGRRGMAHVANPTDTRFREGLERDLAERDRQVAELRSQIQTLEQALAEVVQERDELHGLLNHAKEKK